MACNFFQELLPPIYNRFHSNKEMRVKSTVKETIKIDLKMQLSKWENYLRNKHVDSLKAIIETGDIVS